jgi:ankyrin repeat protein
MTQIRQEIEKLHNAAHEGDADTVNALLNAGVDVNARGEYNRTPLLWAAAYGRAEVVKMLLRRGADPNVKQDCDDATALHWAATGGHADVVEALLKGGADIDAIGQVAWTPLHAAAAKGRATVVETLLRYGADVDAKNFLHQRPLHCAAAYGHEDVVEALLRGSADIDAQDQLGETPLYQACSSKAASMALLLIWHGADPFLKTWRVGPPFAVILQMIKEGEKGFEQVLQAAKDKAPEKCIDWWLRPEA